MNTIILFHAILYTMYNIISTYKNYDIKQQVNTYYYYNHVICKFLKTKFDWMTHITDSKYNCIMSQLKTITSEKSKEHIEPYYMIYTHFLSQHNKIFRKGNTFIDNGSAPGGFLKFAEETKMTGYGITLKISPKNKGIAMKYDFDIIYGDLLDKDFINSLDNKIKTKVDFVNMGAVFYDKENDKQADRMMQLCLYTNQLYIAKKYLKNNGSIMFVADIFHSLMNIVMIADLCISRKWTIYFIPVQPSFQTTQVYVLIENINNFDEIIFQKLLAIKSYTYIPLSKNYHKIIEKIFTSPYFDIDSFRDAYLINVLSKHETITKNRNITINLLSTVYLDIITTINYNLQYIRYTTTFRNACHVDTPLLMSLEKKIQEKRQKFITHNKLSVDETNTILTPTITIELLKQSNRLAKQIDQMYIDFVHN